MRWILVLGAVMVLEGCQHSVGSKQRMESRPDPSSESVTLANRKLFNLVEKEENLFRHMANTGEIYNEEQLQFRVYNLTQEYEALIAETPNEVLPYLFYGKFLRKMRQDEYAVRMFLKADRIDPTIAVVKQQLANYLAEHGKFEEALGFSIQAIALSPETALYHYQLGELLSIYRDNFLRTAIFERSTLDQQMIHAFAEAVRLDPENRDFQFRYAESYYDLEKPRWEEALHAWTALEKTVSSETERAAVRLHRANVLTKLGRYSEALALAEAVDLPAVAYTRQELLNEVAAKTQRESKSPIVKSEK